MVALQVRESCTLYIYIYILYSFSRIFFSTQFYQIFLSNTKIYSQFNGLKNYSYLKIIIYLQTVLWLLYSELWARNAYGCKTKNVYILTITQ